jgi:hypothetical protein
MAEVTSGARSMAESIRHITDQNLLNMIAKFPPDVLHDDSKRAFCTSIGIVKHFFGPDWAEEYISPASRTPSFLRVIPGDGPETQLTTFRIVDFAELLFNLQGIEGVESCLDRMRQGNIEATYAELDFGRMLYSAGVVFKFVEPRQEKGADYDIEIVMADGTTVCADAKCKIETTNFSEKTVQNTLGHARRQFPKDRPSAIFVKIPVRWVETVEAAAQLNAIAHRFLRGTQRVVSVKYYVVQADYENGTLSHRHGFREISNPNNRFFPTRNWDMFAEPNPTNNWNGMPLRWKRILFFPMDGPSH